MDRKLAFFASIAGILLGGVGVLFLPGLLRPKTSGILIETNVPAYVFIDGRQVGRTPYESTLSPHTAFVKLAPEDQSLLSYEVKVDLTVGVKTVIRRNFAQTESGSSGQIISFEKTATEDSEVSIITSPDAAHVVLDGRSRGFTPIKISRVGAGAHQMSLSFPGFLDSAFSVNTASGYRLTVIVKLAQVLKGTLGVKTSQNQGSEVEILGKIGLPLKVYETPNAISNKVGQVNSYEKYKLIGKNSDSSWYEIDLGEGKSGWISAQNASVSGILK